MAHIEPKAAEGIIKTFGPTDEDKKKFAQTFLGSLLGQSVVLVGMLAVYLSVLFAALKYFRAEAKDFEELHGLFWLVALFAAPIVIILAFSFVPTLLRARREARLKRAAIAGDVQFRPDYFRLTPYDNADRSIFKRLDGADGAIFAWLTTTRESILYLSGASGVGKSSIMAASVGPRLLDLGWTIVETRLFGEPIERLRRTLLETKGLFPRKHDAEKPLRDLLAYAAESRAKKGAAPLLLVIDQFEEFLILNNADQRAPFTALLQDLACQPIDGLRLLLVYRSEYRPLVFKLGLPEPTINKNWKEISPYTRGEATTFLRGGGRRFSDEALDQLFHGFDRLEEARGIYRLITLNMVGLILETMGRKLDEDPGRLIQRYLLDRLTSGEGREFTRPVLEHMITDAGTKEPRTESALINLTVLERWQVMSALTGLGVQGVVRRLDGDEPTWEISHDFLARAIGRLIGRLKPTFFQHAQPFVAPVALALWIAFLGLFLPDWLQRNDEQRVMKLISLTHDNGAYFATANDPNFDDVRLSRLAPDLMRLPGSLQLVLADTKVRNIDALKDLKSLTSLDLPITEVANIDALKDFKSLTSLSLSYTKVANIDALQDLKGLTSLDLTKTQVAYIDALQDLKSLTSLDLSYTRVANIDALQDLKSLTSLDLSYTRVANIDALKDLKSLTRLDLTKTQVRTLAPLRGLRIDIPGISDELRATMK